MPWKDAPFEEEPAVSRRWLSRAIPYWKEAVICLLVGFNLFTWTKIGQRKSVDTEVDEFGVNISFTEQLPWKKFTPYNPENNQDRESVNAAWDAIIPDHGIVALDRTWAEGHGLLRSMYLPSNPQKSPVRSRSVPPASLRARRAFFDLIDGKPLERDMDHYNHCFDAILQTIMCTPSTNLMFTFGHRDVNQTQLRRCRSWSALRQWATAHSPCNPSDTVGRNDVFHQDFCHGDTDGLIID